MQELQPPLADLPTITPTFSVVLEAKLTDIDISNERVRNLAWAVENADGVAGPAWERLECSGENDGVCGLRGFIYMLKYGDSTVDQWQIDGVAGSCTHNVLPRASAAPLSNSPLRLIRAGFVPTALTDFGTSAYVGRTEQRGVPADGWTSHHSVQSDGVDYDFDSTMHFYPRGWLFPGRPPQAVDAGAVPLRIVNSGTFTSADNNSTASARAADTRTLTCAHARSRARMHACGECSHARRHKLMHAVHTTHKLKRAHHTRYALRRPRTQTSGTSSGSSGNPRKCETLTCSTRPRSAARWGWTW